MVVRVLGVISCLISCFHQDYLIFRGRSFVFSGEIIIVERAKYPKLVHWYKNRVPSPACVKFIFSFQVANARAVFMYGRQSGNCVSSLACVNFICVLGLPNLCRLFFSWKCHVFANEKVRKFFTYFLTVERKSWWNLTIPEFTKLHELCRFLFISHGAIANADR